MTMSRPLLNVVAPDFGQITSVASTGTGPGRIPTDLLTTRTSARWVPCDDVCCLFRSERWANMTVDV